MRGTVEGTLGFVHTPEAVELIRAAGTGRRHTQEAKARMSKARKAGPKRTLSEAHKAAIRAGSLSWAGTPENRTRVSRQKAGRFVKDETKMRQSAALTGRVLSDATKAKLRAASLGKKQSIETITRKVAAFKATVAKKRAAQSHSSALALEVASAAPPLHAPPSLATRERQSSG